MVKNQHKTLGAAATGLAAIGALSTYFFSGSSKHDAGTNGGQNDAALVDPSTSKSGYSSVEQIVKNFPPALGKCEISVDAPKAMKTLFVVKEYHTVTDHAGIDPRLKDPRFTRVQEGEFDFLQSEVGPILEYLQNRTGAKHLFSDGIGPNECDEVRKLSQLTAKIGPFFKNKFGSDPLKKIDESIENLTNAQSTNPANQQKIINEIQGLREMRELVSTFLQGEHTLNYESLAGRYLVTGKWNLLPTESADLIRKMKDNPSLVPDKSMQKQREDFSIAQIAKMQDSIAVALFGNVHDFTDNIQEWNSLHPELQFRLVQIEPAAITGHYERVKDALLKEGFLGTPIPEQRPPSLAR